MPDDESIDDEIIEESDASNREVVVQRLRELHALAVHYDQVDQSGEDDEVWTELVRLLQQAVDLVDDVHLPLTHIDVRDIKPTFPRCRSLRVEFEPLRCSRQALAHRKQRRARAEPIFGLCDRRLGRVWAGLR
jgi:hypothetical protein